MIPAPFTIDFSQHRVPVLSCRVAARSQVLSRAKIRHETGLDIAVRRVNLRSNNFLFGMFLEETDMFNSELIKFAGK
jgi:hypothetical protein